MEKNSGIEHDPNFNNYGENKDNFFIDSLGVKNNIGPSELNKNLEKRYKFYYAKKVTKHNKNLLTEEEKEDFKNEILDYKKITPDVKKEDLKTPEMEEKINIIKERILNFGKKLGLDFKERLISNEDIVLLMEKKYKKIAGKNGGGSQEGNEIFINQHFSNIGDKEKEHLFHGIQHELWHSVCRRRVTIQKDKRFFSGIFFKKRNYQNITSTLLT